MFGISGKSPWFPVGIGHLEQEKVSVLSLPATCIFRALCSQLGHSRSNISNTRDSVSSEYPNTEKGVENTTRSGVFLTQFEVFGWLMKHCLECLIYLRNQNKN